MGAKTGAGMGDGRGAEAEWTGGGGGMWPCEWGFVAYDDGSARRFMIVVLGASWSEWAWPPGP